MQTRRSILAAALALLFAPILKLAKGKPSSSVTFEADTLQADPGQPWVWVEELTDGKIIGGRWMILENAATMRSAKFTNVS